MTEILDEILDAMTAPGTLLSWDRLVVCELVED